MPRLFTGLELPAEIADEIALARGGVPGARWIEPADYHITLRFLGDVDLGLAHDVAETLGEIRRPPLAVRFDGLSWFGGLKPRALVARVRPNPPLIELQAEQERRMRRIGLEPETRKFTPHVTLARLRGVKTRAVADYLELARRARRRRLHRRALRALFVARQRRRRPLCRRGGLCSGLTPGSAGSALRGRAKPEAPRKSLKSLNPLLENMPDRLLTL